MSAATSTPPSDFALEELAVEVRIHPLTGHVTRFARLGMADFGEYELPEAIAGSAIPIFAPPLVTQITPKFANEDGPERYARGDSVMFPNLNPYDEHSPVVAIGKRPLVEPHDLSPTDIADALILMRDFFRDLDPPQDAGVVGWNFWPASSSSIPHPHIQGISSGRIPTRQQVERDGKNRHRAEHNSDFWADYLDAERDGERWIGEAEGWSAVVDFAPRSLVPETVIIATDGTPGHLQEATEEDAALVADWLTRVAAAHASLGISSFNVLIHPTASPDGAADPAAGAVHAAYPSGSEAAFQRLDMGADGDRRGAHSHPPRDVGAQPAGCVVPGEALPNIPSVTHD